MLKSSKQERKVAQEGQQECNRARADHVLPRLQARRERYNLKEFVHAEAKCDERGGRSDPRHHGALVSEPGALKRQFFAGAEIDDSWV